jgi:AMP-polyphosphate phosphotransferase
MLEKIDLSQRIEKAEYKKTVSPLQVKLGEFQRKARELKIPVIIVFEGWDAAGKGTQINELLLSLDPRGFRVHPVNAPNEEEKMRPPLWRFWIKIPEAGRIAIYDRSWYGRVLVERVDGLIKGKDIPKSFEEIRSFERQLAESGAVIIKFFLHISRKEQKKRFKKIEKNPATRWKVTKEDWKHHKQYEEYCAAINEMMEKTDSEYAPWTVVEAENRRFATAKIFKTVVSALDGRISSEKRARPYKDKKSDRDAGSSVLARADLGLTLSKEEYEDALKICQEKMSEIEHRIYVRRIPIIIVYEGWDAAGKGGNIRRLTQGLDPRGYEVTPVAAPNEIEKAYHYLWRFWTKFPKAGHITIFDRSWYGRVLVERVEGFCKEEEWRRAYREINEMEEQLANFGAVIVKFWLHISKEEQLRRFKERQRTAYKQWKITEEDWRNREKWEAYRKAVDEMLFRTSTTYAPWTVVESNCKYYARIKSLKTIIDAAEKRF